jgi:hypothetical protein
MHCKRIKVRSSNKTTRSVPGYQLDLFAPRHKSLRVLAARFPADDLSEGDGGHFISCSKCTDQNQFYY